MKKITCYQALRVIPSFLILHTRDLSGSKEVGPDVLSGMSIFTWGGDQPAIIDTWFDWKDSLKKNLESEVNVKNRISEVSDFYMTWEQGFISAFFFLDECYWEKNNNITIKEVVDDIEKSINLGQGFFNSTLWKEWLEKAKKSLEYNFEYE
jgi:hypothetical protein